jgi:hypothetical protein
VSFSTNYVDTFIAIAGDCPAEKGLVPRGATTVAALRLSLLRSRPYSMTSDELLFEVHAQRLGLADKDRAAAREAFFAKPLACLRASPLVKTHGWGLHHDSRGRVAAFGVETAAYRRLAGSKDIKVVAGLRSRRARGS